VIETVEPNPVVADLDGDGKQEILYSSYDGRVHAFWLDKTEHANWPFSVYKSTDKPISFASEPVVADLDNDGKAEVIFYILDAKRLVQIWEIVRSELEGPEALCNRSSQPVVQLRYLERWAGGAYPGRIDGDGNLEVDRQHGQFRCSGI